MTLNDVHGPIDFVLLEFPHDGLTGGPGAALMDLVDRGVVRLYDLLVIDKDENGDVRVLEVSETGPFAAFAGARSGLVGEDDVREAAAALKPGTVAALIVYENSWAIPFVAAALDSGGEVVASARIPAPDVMAAVEALEKTA